MKPNDFLLERYFAKHEFSTPYLLCSSDCETIGLSELLEGADRQCRDLWSTLRLGYTETMGHLLLRQQIAQLYSEEMSGDDILVFSGAEEAIFTFMNVILRQSDRLIVQFPTYQSLYEVAESLECDVIKWRMNEDDGWNLNLNELRGLITNGTRAIIVNFPNNPTGFLPSATFMENLIEICEAHNVYLFSDEVYRLLELDSSDRLPSAALLYSKAASLGVMSKAFGLAGLRIGWIATKDKELLNSLARFKDYTTICNSAPSEILALIALRSMEKILDRNLTIIKENLALWDNFFFQHKAWFSWNRPRAGSIAFPKLISSRLGVEEFCDGLRTEFGVLLAPSILYKYEGNNFRIGLGRRNMKKPLEKLVQYVAMLGEP